VLLVVPEVPNQPARKPLIQGFGCRLGSDHVFCETLYCANDVPEQLLDAELHERHRAPVRVVLAWSPMPAGALHGAARIDLAKE
jgi:hypothetical protein